MVGGISSLSFGHQKFASAHSIVSGNQMCDECLNQIRTNLLVCYHLLGGGLSAPVPGRRNGTGSPPPTATLMIPQCLRPTAPGPAADPMAAARRPHEVLRSEERKSNLYFWDCLNSEGNCPQFRPPRMISHGGTSRTHGSPRFAGDVESLGPAPGPRPPGMH